MLNLKELESEINILNHKIKELESSLSELQDFFIELSTPIIKKAVRYVEKTLRHFPPEANQFGDDSKLNFFEEVCVMQQEGSMDDYDMVKSAIESVCKDAYNELSSEEKYIISNPPYLNADFGIDTITEDFFLLVNNYKNNRIEDSYWRRNERES